MRHNLRARTNAMPLKTFLQNSRGSSSVLVIMILVAAGVAFSLVSANWMRSRTDSFMTDVSNAAELQITGLHFYEGEDRAFPGLPNVNVPETGKNVVIDESSDITITGSFNDVTVVGKTHNIWYVGGHNNLTLVSPGTILIDVTDPDITLTQISGGWLLRANPKKTCHPTGRPVVRGDIYLNTEGSSTKTVYIIGGKVIFCDSSYSAVAVTVKNTGTFDVKITGVRLKGKPITANPVPCTVQANSEVAISIDSTFVAGKVYMISIVTSRGSTFNSAVIAKLAT